MGRLPFCRYSTSGGNEQSLDGSEGGGEECLNDIGNIMIVLSSTRLFLRVLV